MDYVTSVERLALDKGREEGRDEGREEGREMAIRLLLRLLTHRFGEVQAPLQSRLHTLTFEQTEQCMDLALTSQSLPEFADQLPPAAEED